MNYFAESTIPVRSEDAIDPRTTHIMLTVSYCMGGKGRYGEDDIFPGYYLNCFPARIVGSQSERGTLQLDLGIHAWLSLPDGAVRSPEADANALRRAEELSKSAVLAVAFRYGLEMTEDLSSYSFELVSE